MAVGRPHVVRGIGWVCMLCLLGAQLPQIKVLPGHRCRLQALVTTSAYPSILNRWHSHSPSGNAKWTWLPGPDTTGRNMDVDESHEKRLRPTVNVLFRLPVQAGLADHQAMVGFDRFNVSKVEGLRYLMTTLFEVWKVRSSSSKDWPHQMINLIDPLQVGSWNALH